MNKVIIISVSIALLISVLMAFYGREDFYLIGITAFVTFVVIAASLLATVILFIVGKTEKSTKLISASKYAGLVSVVALILFSSIFIAVELSKYDAKQAKKFCNSLIVKIDKFKEVNSQYPDTIDEVLSYDTKLPVGLKNYRFYQSDGVVYRFVIPVMGPNASGYVYDSRDKNWQLVDFVFDLERL